MPPQQFGEEPKAKHPEVKRRPERAEPRRGREATSRKVWFGRGVVFGCFSAGGEDAVRHPLERDRRERGKAGVSRLVFGRLGVIWLGVVAVFGWVVSWVLKRMPLGIRWSATVGSAES